MNEYAVLVRHSQIAFLFSEISHQSALFLHRQALHSQHRVMDDRKRKFGDRNKDEHRLRWEYSGVSSNQRRALDMLLDLGF